MRCESLYAPSGVHQQIYMHPFSFKFGEKVFTPEHDSFIYITGIKGVKAIYF